MLHSIKRLIFLFLAGLSLSLAPVSADPLAIQGRECGKLWRDSVVPVTLEIEQKMVLGGECLHEEVTTIHTTGVHLDTQGLTVISLTVTKPDVFLAHFLDDDRLSDAYVPEARWISRVSQVRIMTLGETMEASIIHRDPKYDLAFIEPKPSKKKVFPYLKPSDLKEPRVMDSLLVLVRMAEVADRRLAVNPARVQAILRIPETFYVPYPEDYLALGAPVFDAQGNWLGVVALRRSRNAVKGYGRLFSGPGGNGILPVIVPVSIIQDKIKLLHPE